jgi:hypothetical protein
MSKAMGRKSTLRHNATFCRANDRAGQMVADFAMMALTTEGHVMKQPMANDKVAAAYAAFPPEIQSMAMTLRDLVFDVAKDTPEAGEIEETLKWGQPAYLTPQTKSGSTLRIGPAKGGGIGLFAHCGTTIISSYANTFPNTDKIEGNRAVIFTHADDIAPERLRLLIRHGLTYHLPG